MFYSPLFAGWFQTIAGMLMFLGSLFLILLVLVQRGRGGGLSGAFGGMGGQSAFGAKAGDTFTRITIVTAAIWILICMAAVRFTGNQEESLLTDTAVESALDADLGTDDASPMDVDSRESGTDSSLLDQATSGALGETAGDSEGNTANDASESTPPGDASPTENASESDSSQTSEDNTEKDG